MAGILIPCTLPWVFKKFATAYSLITLERFAQPLLIAVLSEQATKEVLDSAVDQLEEITASSAGAIRASGDVKEINSQSGTAGSAHQRYIEMFEEQITKGILGSTLNTDGGSDGGSYAMAQSQGTTTILPRIKSIANSLAETLKEQWFAHEVEQNLDLFGGFAPKPAEPYFELLGEEPTKIEAFHVDNGVVKFNELRESAGLDPDETRGDEYIAPAAPPPAFADVEVLEDAPPPKALRRKAHQLRLPMALGTSPTSGRSTTQIDNLPLD